MVVEYENEISCSCIKVSPRPVWKCESCPEYGIRPSCPPAARHWKEAAEWAACYEKALVIKFRFSSPETFDDEKREILEYLLEREKGLYSKSMYAFALFPGSCNLCRECSCRDGLLCKRPHDVRPSINALGIEISSFAEIDFNENSLYGMIMIS